MFVNRAKLYILSTVGFLIWGYYYEHEQLLSLYMKCFVMGTDTVNLLYILVAGYRYYRRRTTKSIKYIVVCSTVLVTTKVAHHLVALCVGYRFHDYLLVELFDVLSGVGVIYGIWAGVNYVFPVE